MTKEEALGIWLPLVLLEFHDYPQCEEAIRIASRALVQEIILDKIRAELHITAEMHEDGDYYLREEWIDEIFDKYKAESGE